MKQTILDTVDDLVSNFMYYDRKEDEVLYRGMIERCIKQGIITSDEIVDKFRETLENSLKETE